MLPALVMSGVFPLSMEVAVPSSAFVGGTTGQGEGPAVASYPLAATQRLSVRLDPLQEDDLPLVILAALIFVALGLTWLTMLVRLLITIVADAPFTPENVARLRALSWWVGAGGTLGALAIDLITQQLAHERIGGGYGFRITFTPIVVALLVSVVTAVSAHGLRLRQSLEVPR